MALSDPIPSPSILPPHEGELWRAVFAAAWIQPDPSRSGALVVPGETLSISSHRDSCAGTADRALRAYREICLERSRQP
jgi:hypothetical protein